MRNPDKNRVLKAIRHCETTEIPLLEMDPDIVIVNQILDQQFPLSLHAYELPVPDYVELNRRMGNDMLYFARIWRLGRREKSDEEGRIHYIDGTMKTPEALADVWFPDLDAVERSLEQTLNAVECTGMGVICACKHAPGVVCTAVGMQDYWINSIDNPDFIHDFHQIIHEYSLRELELFARYRVEAVMFALGVGMKSGPMCSPAMLEEFQYPTLRELVQTAKSHGMAVWVHVDGNVAQMMADFVDMGVDVLHPMEPCDGVQNIYAVKEQYGERITLHGNIDVAGVLAQGTPEEIRQDTLEHMERLGVGGGYIVGSSHDLNATIPVESFYAMRDAVHEYRLGRE